MISIKVASFVLTSLFAFGLRLPHQTSCHGDRSYTLHYIALQITHTLRIHYTYTYTLHIHYTYTYITHRITHYDIYDIGPVLQVA